MASTLKKPASAGFFKSNACRATMVLAFSRNAQYVFSYMSLMTKLALGAEENKRFSVRDTKI